jgi:hypothetical protein
MMNSTDPRLETPAPQSGSRRRLLRGGLVAAPVLMTVASRPVLGQVACTASAITSINMQSSLNHNCSITSGLSPDKWKTLAAQWPAPYSGVSAATSTSTTSTSTVTQKSTTNNNVLLQQQLAAAAGYTPSTTTSTGGTTTSSGSSYGATATPYHCSTTGLGGRVFAGKSMVEVIDLMQSGGLNSLGRYIVAALLNARSGRTPMLSETNVRAMWNDLINRGYYEPTAGIRWGATEIVAYIKTTIA